MLLKRPSIEEFHPIKLSKGHHDTYKDGICINELVSMLSNEEFTANPECMSNCLKIYCSRLNDYTCQAIRDKLMTYVFTLMNTHSYVNLDSEISRVKCLLSHTFSTFIPSMLIHMNNYDYLRRLNNLESDITDTEKGIDLIIDTFNLLLFNKDVYLVLNEKAIDLSTHLFWKDALVKYEYPYDTIVEDMVHDITIACISIILLEYKDNSKNSEYYIFDTLDDMVKVDSNRKININENKKRLNEIKKMLESA